MKLLVFGATGGVGAALCRAAAARGDRVTAFVRSRARLPADVAAALAGVVEGDATDAKAVAAAIGGDAAAFDAVLVAIGGAGIMARDHIRSTSTKNIVAAMAAAPGAPFAAPLAGGGARLVVCSSMGVNESLPWIPSFIAWMLKHALADHGEQEDAVRASPLPFVIARPTGLSNDAASAAGVRKVLAGAVPVSRVARADVARFMLDCLGSGEFVGKAVGICAPA
jgi:uncharacterized protein YbjT (DUF2867 family)